MHVPGSGKNLRIARATPAPALSMSASTSTPRANAASSVSRICAELKIGESIVATDEHRLTQIQSAELNSPPAAARVSAGMRSGRAAAAVVFLRTGPLLRFGFGTLLRFLAAGRF